MSKVVKVTAFSKFVSPEGRVSMTWEDHAGDTVRITDRHGTVGECVVIGTSETPDNEPLLMVRDGADVCWIFGEDIVSVESIEGV